MGELVKKVICFFESERVSIFRKIAIPMLVILVAFSLDNILGISYYWTNGLEVDYLVKIEEAKAKCGTDLTVLSHLDSKMNEAISRKNVFQWFASLFENSNIGKSEEVVSPDINSGILDILGKWFPVLERNQLWHTVTSSLLWIILLMLLLPVLILAPFFAQKDKAAIIVGIVLGLGVLVFLIWVTQLLFGLIPIILNRAYINYIIQLAINSIPIISLTIGSIKEHRNKKKIQNC